MIKSIRLSLITLALVYALLITISYVLLGGQGDTRELLNQWHLGVVSKILIIGTTICLALAFVQLRKNWNIIKVNHWRDWVIIAVLSSCATAVGLVFAWVNNFPLGGMYFILLGATVVFAAISVFGLVRFGAVHRDLVQIQNYSTGALQSGQIVISASKSQ